MHRSFFQYKTCLRVKNFLVKPVAPSILKNHQKNNFLIFQTGKKIIDGVYLQTTLICLIKGYALLFTSEKKFHLGPSY